MSSKPIARTDNAVLARLSDSFECLGVGDVGPAPEGLWIPCLSIGIDVAKLPIFPTEFIFLRNWHSHGQESGLRAGMIAQGCAGAVPVFTKSRQGSVAVLSMRTEPRSAPAIQQSFSEPGTFERFMSPTDRLGTLRSRLVEPGPLPRLRPAAQKHCPGVLEFAVLRVFV